MGRKQPTKRKPSEQKRTTQRAPVDTWDKAFLASFRVLGNVTAACKAAQVGRTTVYERRASDPAFLAAWNDALEEASDRLELEARRRAVRGTHKPVWYKGRIVGFEVEKSDTLMTLLLKGNRPEKFANKLIVEIKPEHAALLKKLGITPSDAWLQLMQDLADAASADR